LDNISKALNTSITPEKINKTLKSLGESPMKHAAPAKQILKRPSLGIEGLPKKLFREIKKTYKTSPFLFESFIEAEALVKYQGYIKRQDEQVKKMLKQENQEIPLGFDYMRTNSLSNESREKLHLVRPQTLGQAMRVSGVTPADISVLSVFLNSFE
jgi:tRNA uridine 5-carboxymethylaminomethyl modification enzyme